MINSLVSLLACMVAPNIVAGHGFMVSPDPTWVVNPFNDKNAPASFYQSTEAERQLNPLDVYPNLRFIIDRDVPNTNIPVIAANANKKCGMTSATGTVRSISDSFQFGNYPGTGVVPHVGPCEVWVDDVRTMVSRYCLNDYPSWRIPVDMSKCTRATCVVQFIWVATHNPGYEVFKNCVQVIGSSGGTTPTTSPTTSPTPSPTTSPTTCKIAANGGSCGASNGGVYCPGTQCCSQYGYCGVGSPWCDANPNSGYNGGKCSTAPKCTTVAPAGGSCGTGNGGAYCPGTQCCSQYGYCGVGSPWCDSNPNSAYNGGKCTP